MPPELLSIIIQAGATGILIVVLWQVNVRIGEMMDNVQALLIKLIDLVAIQGQKTDRNFVAIKEATKEERDRPNK
jgi:hypothetical protein